MVDNTLVSVPVWFNEGLAEYYSTFEIDDDKKVAIGKAVPEHVFWLRDHGVLPLKTLFAVDHNSPYYNEKNKQTFFYAESWLLMHYLLLGNNQQRVPHLGSFLQQLSNGVPVEKAFTQAFQTDFPAMEKELKKYAGQNSFPLQTFTFKQKLEFDTDMSAAPVTEAEAQAYLGDLLVHTHRLDDAEKYLQQALALDSASPMANSSLGVLRTYQGRMDDARAALQKAVGGDSKNFLAHFYYAMALSGVGPGGSAGISDYPRETAELIRAELKKTITLSPTFPEAYRLLAHVNLVTGDQIEETISMVKTALGFAANNDDMRIVLAELYLRKEDFAAAKQVLEPIAANAPDEEDRARAKSILESVNRYLAQVEEFKARQNAALAEEEHPLSTEGGSSDTSPGAPRLKRRSDKVLGSSTSRDNDGKSKIDLEASGLGGFQNGVLQPGEGEKSFRGQLMTMQCGDRGAVLTVNDGTQTIKLSKAQFETIQFLSFRPDLNGEISCNNRNLPIDVVVIYRPSTGGRVAGEVISVQFVPKEMK
jgi:tetratricopeptide (TPR) repeat protein